MYYAFMYVSMCSSIPTPLKYLDLVGAYVCMYVQVCTDIIEVIEGGHGLSGVLWGCLWGLGLW